MRPNPVSPPPLLLAALLCCTAPGVHSEMYKWVNDDDTTTYSSQPPAEPATARDMTVIKETPPVTQVTGQSAPAERQSTSANPEFEAAPRVAAVRSKLPQAVQDPCLTSSDRYCHQKHWAQYLPYVGYAPNGESVAETNPAIVPLPRGASSAAAGSGAVGGGSRAPAARAEQAK